MRVKRYHTDNNGLGGYGGDQCYLEGRSVHNYSLQPMNHCGDLS